jgi:hypothetical protein
MSEHAPAPLRVSRDSALPSLMSGSGFGKVVLHVALRGRVRRSVDMQYVLVRLHQDKLTLQHLISGRVPGLVDTEAVLPTLRTSSRSTP